MRLLQLQTNITQLPSNSPPHLCLEAWRTVVPSFPWLTSCLCWEAVTNLQHGSRSSGRFKSEELTIATRPACVGRWVAVLCARPLNSPGSPVLTVVSGPSSRCREPTAVQRIIPPCSFLPSNATILKPPDRIRWCSGKENQPRATKPGPCAGFSLFFPVSFFFALYGQLLSRGKGEFFVERYYRANTLLPR